MKQACDIYNINQIQKILQVYENDKIKISSVKGRYVNGYLDRKSDYKHLVNFDSDHLYIDKYILQQVVRAVQGHHRYQLNGLEILIGSL